MQIYPINTPLNWPEFCFKLGTVHTAIISSSEAVPLFIRSRILTHRGILDFGNSSVARLGFLIFYLFLWSYYVLMPFLRKSRNSSVENKENFPFGPALCNLHICVFSNKFYLVSEQSPPHPSLTACPHFQYRKGPTCTPSPTPWDSQFPRSLCKVRVTIGPPPPQIVLP
jgi:hypothetical protein